MTEILTIMITYSSINAVANNLPSTFWTLACSLPPSEGLPCPSQVLKNPQAEHQKSVRADHENHTDKQYGERWVTGKSVPSNSNISLSRFPAIGRVRGMIIKNRHQHRKSPVMSKKVFQLIRATANRTSLRRGKEINFHRQRSGCRSRSAGSTEMNETDEIPANPVAGTPTQPAWPSSHELQSSGRNHSVVRSTVITAIKSDDDVNQNAVHP